MTRKEQNTTTENLLNTTYKWITKESYIKGLLLMLCFINFKGWNLKLLSHNMKLMIFQIFFTIPMLKKIF